VINGVPQALKFLSISLIAIVTCDKLLKSWVAASRKSEEKNLNSLKIKIRQTKYKLGQLICPSQVVFLFYAYLSLARLFEQ